MKKINDPLSYESVINKLKKKTRAKNKFILVMVPFLTLLSTFDSVLYEQKVYDEMNITFSDAKTVEYGTEFKALDYIDEVATGDVIFTGEVDTNKLGDYKVIYVVSDGTVSREFYNNIEVIDTVSPDINIKEENVSIYSGDDYDLLSNISSVFDQVDGELSYLADVTDQDKGYYTIDTDFNNDVVGEYDVRVKAVDLSGNVSENSYTISVKKKVVYTYNYSYTNANVSSTVDTTSVVSAAYSFLGYRYTYAGASPETGFDCTGFVYYIYGLFGKTVGRSSSDIIYSGTGVSIDNMSPGDIIVWSTRADNGPTHAALYVGDGMMIHAANPSQGVILSSIDGWARNSHIVAVRRV